MATLVEKIVDPDNGGGTDYTSLDSWEDNFGGHTSGDGDLVSDDEYVVADCRCTGGTADTAAVTIDGWTVDATRYIQIWTDSGETYRHNGTWQTGNKYRLEVGGADAIDCNEGYVNIIGLQIAHTSGNFHQCIDLSIDNCTVSHCIIKNTGGLRTQGILLAIYQGPDTLIYNNIIYDMDDGDASASGQDGIWCSSSNVWGKIYNNTIYNCHDGIEVAADNANMIVENNHVTESVDGADYVWPGTTANIVSNNNLSEDETADDAGGSNHQTGVDPADEFTTEGSDFHLKAGATAIDAGKDLSGTFTDDIDGVTRAGTWDIGADGITAAATGNPWYAYAQQ